MMYFNFQIIFWLVFSHDRAGLLLPPSTPARSDNNKNEAPQSQEQSEFATVSAVPRPRAAVHMESRSPYANSASVDIQNCIKHLTEDDAIRNYKNSQENRKINENGIKNAGHREGKSSDHCKKRVVNHNPIEADINKISFEDDEKDKKKERKWTLGGFFRRKCRKDADDSSEESEGKKGFLSRRISKRERRKPRAKSTANGFDVIIPQQKDSSTVNGIGKTVDELWGNQNGEIKGVNGVTGPVRYIYRHQNNGILNTELPKMKDALLQIPRHSRRDSNLSRNSSGGSGSLEGRKGRKEVLARAEAKRDQMRDESSSDENESYHSSSSLSKVNPEGRRPRARHCKRLSRDEESLAMQKENDFRVVKSDFEGHRFPQNSRWIPRSYYQDLSDHENLKFNLINHSGTPSPARSPRVRQKHLPPNSLLPMPNSYPVNTFPPGMHYSQGMNGPYYKNLYSIPKYIHTKDPQFHVSQQSVNVNYRKTNRNSEFVQPCKRSTSEHSTNRKILLDYEKFLSSCGASKEKSISYDQDIHRASYFENDPSEPALGQYGISTINVHGMIPESYGDGRKRDSSPRDLRRIPGANPYVDVPQRTGISSYENDNVENPSMTTNSLPAQHGNTHMVQRSASGNSFTNVYENSKRIAYNQIRSNSYQHIPSYISQQQQQAIQNRTNPDRLIASVQFAQNGIKPAQYKTMADTVTANPAIVQNDAKDQFHVTFPQSAAKDPPPLASRTESVQLPLPKSHVNSTIPNLRYYADQNPRSRNPIHITCNMAPSPTNDQKVPTDSQVAKNNQNPGRNSVTNASDFWKLKDQESLMGMQMKKACSSVPASSVKSPPQTVAREEESRPSSPSARAKTCHEVKKIAATESANGKAMKDEMNVAKILVRKNAKQEIPPKGKAQAEAHNSNLDDALNELESIYNSLKLGDEDLVVRAERRDLSAYNIKQDQPKSVKSSKYPSESAPLLNHLHKSKSPYNGAYLDEEYQKAEQQRRSGVPDKVSDDMAYRRMNSKERSESKKFPSHSYLRSSQALSPIMGDNSSNTNHKEPSLEPDITYDDVVFRNLRHANSTLKIQDPQPPFGIPLGPITPAPNSDYLHANPKETFRPTFTSSKVPDVVKDDLAFRNLRKDNMAAKIAIPDNSVANKNGHLSNQNYLMQKKRAVRSLSANLYNLIQKDSFEHPMIEANNNLLEKDFEKTKSLTDLSEKEGKKALEKRLKELKEEKNAKRAEFFELAKEQRKKRNSKSKLSWTELAHLNGDFENMPQINTSTETLTEENENKKSGSRGIQQRLRVNFNSEDSNALCQTPEPKTYRSPVVELSKYPAAAPSSSLYSNPFREPASGSPLDESQLDDLLSALEKEAKSASEDLGRQLVELEFNSTKDEERSRNHAADNVKRSPSAAASDKTENEGKRKSPEKKSERSGRRTSPAEREATPDDPSGEKSPDMIEGFCSAVQADGLESKRDEAKPSEDVGKLASEIIQVTEELIRRGTSTASRANPPKERKRSSACFEVVTDLSQILHEMEEQQTSKPKDTFQEVYEYNCGLTGVGAGRSDGESRSEGEEAGTTPGSESSKEKDIEREFEKLHLEVDTTEVDCSAIDDEDDMVVKELIADVTSGSGTPSDLYSPRPFPNELNGVSSKSIALRREDGPSPGSSNGEGCGNA